MRLKYVKEKIVLHSKDDQGSAWTLMRSLLFSQTQGRTKKGVRGFTAFVHCGEVKHECCTAKMTRGQLGR
jgi:hypothetical protein